jgi:hypothetical protein
MKRFISRLAINITLVSFVIGESPTAQQPSPKCRKVKNLGSNGSDVGKSLADSPYDGIRHPLASRISRFPH